MIRFKKDDGSNYSEWEKKKLKEITEKICVGFVGTCEEFYTDNNGIPMYRTGNLKDGKVILDDMKYVTREFHEKNKKSQLKNRDLLIARHGSNGQASMYKSNNEANCLNIVIVRPDNTKLNDEFLLQYINSQPIKRQVSILTAGSTQSVINTKEIENLIIRFPSNNKEQQKIADFLSSVDDVIAASEQEVVALEEQKKGAMQKIFSQEVRFKADDGSDYPEWEEKRLEEIGEFYGGLSGKTKDDFGKGEDKYITYMNVYKNTFAKNELLDTVIISENEKQNRVKYGDVLFTQSSETVEEVGLTSVYLFDDEPTLNSFCFGLRTNDMKETYPEFMGYLFRTEYVRKQIMREGQGISRINLSPNRIRSVSMFFPCLKEQQKIANFLSDFDKAIDLAKQELEQWKELKKGLLQQLFE